MARRLQPARPRKELNCYGTSAPLFFSFRALRSTFRDQYANISKPVSASGGMSIGMSNYRTIISLRQRIDGRPRIGMRIKPAAAFGADAAPLTGEKGAAEQVGPDFETEEAPFVALGPDADQAGGFRKERQLYRDGPGRCCLAAFGHDVAESVSLRAKSYQGRLFKRILAR